MEDKNELSDIVLEKEDDKSQKVKRILLIAALLIVIFLVTIVVMKVTNDSKTTNDTPKLNLPPEPITKSVETKVEQEEELFKKVDIQEADDKKESFEEMVKSLKAKEKQKIKEEVVKEAQKELPAPVNKKVEEAKEPVKAKPVKKVTKELPKTKKAETTISSLATTGVYVQVGATSRLSPDKKFLKSITSKDYSYKLLPIDVKGKKVTKILIGPYKSTKEAKAVLGDIKSKINKDAFIYRVK